MGPKPVNKFFDINKLPPVEGLLVFPISMSRISNAQSAENCWEYMKIFSPNKVIKPLVGLNIIYGDFLYFNSDEKASELKNKFSHLTTAHKSKMKKILSKNPYYIEPAFSFTTWNQAVLDFEGMFNGHFGELKKLYRSDETFQSYIEQDLINTGRSTLDENQLSFFLEEILLFYLVTKGEVNLRNDYVRGHEKWVLWCYPGKPLKSQIYISQLNPFNLENEENEYEDCHYDLEEQKLYEFSAIDLSSLSLYD